MEARIAKLEADTENMKTNIADIKTDIRDIKKDMRSDFRLVFGAIITVAVSLAALMAKGFGWL